MALESTFEDGVPAEGAINEGKPPETDGDTQDPAATAAGEPAAANEVVDGIAKDMGWRPKEQFKGDPEDWVDSATFIRRGGDIQHQRKRQIDELSMTVKELKAFNERVYKAENAKLREELDTLKADRKDAIRQSDVELVEKLDAQISDVSERIAEAPKEVDPVVQGNKAVLASWKASNPWFGADSELTDLADGIAEKAKADGLTLDATLRKINKEVKELYPEKFKAKQAAAQAPQAESVLDPTRSAPDSKGKILRFSDLPPEAQASAIRFEKAGGMTRTEYLKNYQASL